MSMKRLAAVLLTCSSACLWTHATTLAQEASDDPATSLQSWNELKSGELVVYQTWDAMPEEGFLIQLGAFGKTAFLDNYVQTYHLEGLNLLALPYSKDDGVLILLAYGPFRFRDNAREVERHLKREYGVETWIREISSIPQAGLSTE